MPTLTRRLDETSQHEHWRIFYGDIEIGSIGIRSGVPIHGEHWIWRCGCYPASHRGIRDEGTARDFNQAREDFEAAWRDLLPQITEDDFAEHRRERSYTAWKYEMWERGCKLPTQLPEGRSRCFCGAEIDIASTDRHVYINHAR